VHVSRGILRVAHCNVAVPAASLVHKLQQAEIKLQAFKVYLSLAKCTASLPTLPQLEKAPLLIVSEMLNTMNPIATSFYRPVGGVQPSVTRIPVATEFTFGVLITNERHLLLQIACRPFDTRCTISQQANRRGNRVFPWAAAGDSSR